MMTIAEQHRARYDEMWGIEAYSRHSPGLTFLPLFLDMSQTHMGGSVLDAGCGSGQAALGLRAAGFDVTLCDLSDEGLVDETKGLPFVRASLWHNLRRQVGFKDWVYCCDVLEHVPEAFTMLVVSRLLEVARRGVFLSVCLVQDNFGVFAGAPLHETVRDFGWWKEQLSELAPIVECRDLLTNGVFLLEA